MTTKTPATPVKKAPTPVKKAPTPVKKPATPVKKSSKPVEIAPKPVEITPMADTPQDAIESTTEIVAVIDSESLVITESPVDIKLPPLTPTPDAAAGDEIIDVIVLNDDKADVIAPTIENAAALTNEPYVFDQSLDPDFDAKTEVVIDETNSEEDSYFHLFFHALSSNGQQVHGNIQITNKGMFGIARANVMISQTFNVRDVVLLGWESLTKSDYKALLEPIPVVNEDAKERYFHLFFHAITTTGNEVHGNIQITNKGIFNLVYSSTLIEQKFSVRDAIILGWKELNQSDYEQLIS